MEISGPLLKSSSSNQYVFYFTDWYTKLTRAFSVNRVEITFAASVFFDHMIISYGASMHLLTDNGLESVSKFFTAFWGYLWVRNVTTTANHLHTNGQVELFIQTNVDWLSKYLTEHQTEWNKFFQPLTYVYDRQMHCFMRTISFSFGLS